MLDDLPDEAIIAGGAAIVCTLAKCAAAATGAKLSHSGLVFNARQTRVGS